MMQVCRNAADLFCQNSAGLEEFLNSKKNEVKYSYYQPPLNACLACGRAGGGDRAGLPKHDLFY